MRYVMRPKAFGPEYEFSEFYDEVPWHQHPPEPEHDIECLAGWLRVEVTGEVSRFLIPGDVLRFNGRKRHRVVALSPNSVCFNRMHELPDDYQERLRLYGEWQCL